MSARRWLSLVGLLASALGCAEAGPDGSTSRRREPIVGGEASGAEQDGVVLLRAELDEGEVLCSASLVGPNLLLTARHCVAYLTEGQFSCTVRGEPTDNPTGGGRLGLHLPAADLEVYGRKTPRKTILAHGLRIISTQSPTPCRNDLAFVVLDTALDLPLVPLRLGRSAQAHELGVLVGYGLDGEQQAIDYRTQARAQRRDLEIEAVGPDSISDGVTTVPPRSLLLQGPSGCIGDSGGPLLSQETGAILGVYSLQRGESCTAPGVVHRLTHVPPFRALIDEAFTAAGGEPVPEPTGEAGAAGAANVNGPAAEAGATNVNGPAAEAGAANEPSEAGGAGGAPNANAAGTPATAPPRPEPARRASCGFAGRTVGHDPACWLALLVGATAVQRRRAARELG